MMCVVVLKCRHLAVLVLSLLLILNPGLYVDLVRYFFDLNLEHLRKVMAV